ncbi:chaperone NapD [Campylobacter cuniculorum]|uniref:chaperone NapD n=1 Tax=Campylobacter cuniculorum TaxID=374106 RepID=UPI0023EFB24C|nr:chaperone NapD [Campylobacter cuniculorum]
MNISSILLIVKQEDQEEFLKNLKKIKGCSIELIEKEKIIAVIESDTLENELSIYKSIEALPKLISINMVFSYQDLDEDIQKVTNSNAIEVIEKNERAEDIEYHGTIFNKFF